MSSNFKFILGVAVGAAVGAAIGYAISSGKKDEWLEILKDKAEKIKDDLEMAADKINNSVQGIASRVVYDE